MFTAEQVNAAVIAATNVERGKAMSYMDSRERKGPPSKASQRGQSANFSSDYDEYSVMSDPRTREESAHMAVGDEQSVSLLEQVRVMEHCCAVTRTMSDNHCSITNTLSTMSAMIARTEHHTNCMLTQMYANNNQLQIIMGMINGIAHMQMQVNRADDNQYANMAMEESIDQSTESDDTGAAIPTLASGSATLASDGLPQQQDAPIVGQIKLLLV